MQRYEYDYVAETDDTIEYAYDDATWGDLLTSYDGTEFAYDEVGNLLRNKGMVLLAPNY